MKFSYFKNVNNNKKYESFSCQRQSISFSHKILEFYGSPKSDRVQQSETPQRSEDNFQGALLLGKEMIK